jgi:hypothetical protein
MNNNNNKSKRHSQETIFIVNENYAGVKNISDIFADLLYSAYCKQEPENSGNGLNPSGYLPIQTGHTHYGDGAY